MNTPRGLAAVTLTVALLVAGCGESVELDAADFWARPTPPGADSVAVYGTIVNESTEMGILVAGYAPTCETLEVHDVGMTDDNVMQMRPADPSQLVIEPGESLQLEPMALHLMCIGLEDTLETGDEISLELTVEGVGVAETTVRIEDR